MTDSQRISAIWLPIFTACVVILSVWFLFIDFRGLTHPQGMEQAAVSRELARGNGLSTKSQSAFALYLRGQHLASQEKPLSLENFPETTYAPLHPVIQSGILSLNKRSWEVSETDQASAEGTQTSNDSNNDASENKEQEQTQGIYLPDRALALWSIFLFVIALIINGVLISRLFDLKIAYFSIISLITCSLFWDFVQTGLPQMLMLVLFSAGALCLQIALKREEDEKNNLFQVVLAALFFALLCLAHWLCLWIAFAALLFVILGLKDKAVKGSLFLLILLPGPLWWMGSQANHIGDFMGVGFYAPMQQLVNTELQDGTLFFRGYKNQFSGISPRDIPARVIILTSDQIQNLFSYLGGVLAAPVFFISLIWPFQRAATAHLRWGILLMWVFALAGMSFYGLHDQGAEANQLHLLFIPLMSAYGFAFINLLWNRLELSEQMPLKGSLPLVIMVAASVLPLILSMSRDVRFVQIEQDQARRDAGVFPISVNSLRNLREEVGEDEFVLTDMPWAVAWYADRNAVWLPTNLDDLAELIKDLENGGQACAGISLSYESADKSLLRYYMTANSPDLAFNHLFLGTHFQIASQQTLNYDELGLEFTQLNELTHEQGQAPLLLFEKPKDTQDIDQ